MGMVGRDYLSDQFVGLDVASYCGNGVIDTFSTEIDCFQSCSEWYKCD